MTPPTAGRAGTCCQASPPSPAPDGGVQLEMLTEARTDLQCGLAQSHRSDCQIMIGRFRSALVWLDALDKVMR